MADHSYATMHGGYSPLDRAYSDPLWRDAQTETKLAQPIIPFKDIGQTVPENDPRTGAHILQNVQAAIRSGVGNIQIVMSVSSSQAMGGGFKAYGPESREQLRHMFEESGTQLGGIELPTSVSNLSGYDPQQGGFSDDRMQRDRQEVRDAIKFVADVGRGGGIDILSWEFERGLSDAKWNKTIDKDGKKLWMFGHAGNTKEEQERMETVQIVDSKSGRIQGFRKSEEQFLPFDPETLDPTKKRDEWKEIPAMPGEMPRLKEWKWSHYEQVADRINKDIKDPSQKWTPTKVFIMVLENGQLNTLDGYANMYRSEALKHEATAKKLEAAAVELTENPDPQRGTPEELRRDAEDERRAARERMRLAVGQQQQAKQLEERSNRQIPVEKFALDRATESYAELGIAAMQETHNRGLANNPIHIGPESGWPQFFGSHPKEFVQLIMDSREKMAAKLVAEHHLSPEEARKEAQTHIKGELDTSHLGMFFEHFRPDEKDQDKRLKEFNKWFLDQVTDLAEVNAKEQILGGVQIVNSMTGSHAHLPPSQGVFPVIEAARILKEKGKFDGPMTSEGHEEEKFGQGRIIFDAWANLAGNIMSPSYVGGSGGAGGLGGKWLNPQSSYFGRAYAPTQMFGEYAPNQEFRLWSDVPLE
jgi:hypothetical protein